MIEYFVVGLVLLAIPFFISPLGRKKNVEKRENSENATTRAHYNFPDDPVLARLLASSYHKAWSSQTVIYDARGFQKSYIELLGDIIYTAHLIRSELPPSVLDKRGLLNTESCPIGILVRSGYEFIVAFFAARVMGGAAMPMASGILPEEAHYLISKSKAALILAGKGCHDKASKIREFAKSQGTSISSLPISTNAKPKPDSITVTVDKNLPLDPLSPGILLFTSGTTGLPKGVVLTRKTLSFPDKVETPGGIALSHRACHWIAGTNSLISSVLSGKTLHILNENAGAKELLDAMSRQRFTQVAFTPTLLREMKTLILASGNEPERYAARFQGLPAIRCSAAPIDQLLRDFWTGLTGLPFENIYSSTETGGVISRAVGRVNGSIGTTIPGNEVKLSEGDSGEILVKTRGMFTHYLGDEEKTKEAFDRDGFYKTGDTAELRDGEIIFAGRAATDYISFRYFRISALVVHARLMELPYVADAYVLGVPYHEARQLCGAVVRLRSEISDNKVDLARIRDDLSHDMATYMLPVVLRILKGGEELPRTVSGKPVGREILSKFFGTTVSLPVEDLPQGVEYCGCTPVIDEETTRPWD